MILGRGKRNCIFVGIVLLILCTSSSFVIANPVHTSMIQPDYVYVDDDFDENTTGWGVDHFDNIQDGVFAVAINGTVEVAEGVYYENVEFSKSLKLIGEDPSTTIIDGMNTSEVVKINADYAEVSSFTIRNGTSGITSSGAYTIISGNMITNNYNMGIILSGIGSQSNVVRENTIADNGHSYPGGNRSNYGGINLALSQTNRFMNNNFYNNSDVNAFFWKSFFNLWLYNYWDRPRLLPYPILGLQSIIPPIFWFQFDWRPRLSPYEQ